jgi:dipeptidyl-peptidase 4
MFYFVVMFLIAKTCLAQNNITLEDIWLKGTFSTRGVPGFNFMKDGNHYTRTEGGNIVKYDLVSGSKVSSIFEGASFKGKSGFDGMQSYSFNNDESKILIFSASESIFRHSSKEICHIYNVVDKTITPVFESKKVINPSLSPDGTKLAFVSDFNLYVTDLKTNKTTQITKDGAKNMVLNGMCDWVYEEEFSFTKAYEWNATGDKIGFIRFDEREVPEFSMEFYNNDMYPARETFKYPKVGEKNSKVSVHIYDLKSKKLALAEIGSLDEMYVPRILWTQNPDQLAVFKLNRHQNHLQILSYDAKSKKPSTIVDEKNKYFIEINDDFRFTKDKTSLVRTSEKNGYNQIFNINLASGKEICLTPGKYDVLSISGIDEANKKVYFLAAEKSPMDHQVFSVTFDGTQKSIITDKSGANSVQFSPTFDYFVWQNSTANSPATYTVYDKNITSVRVIEDNAKAEQIISNYAVNPIEFFKFSTSEGVELNAWMIKPKDFNPNRKYPVLMTQYSGPGSQQVTDSWKGANYWWYQHLAQEGYFVVCVDPRGTGARGEEFRKQTYMKLGHYETIDQIEAARYLAKQPYIDASRIGIYGWSYGGYMSSLALLKGNDIFKAAIAIAPVTNWKWYDSIYTERYMRTYKENKAGFDDNSPINFVDRLKGNYLICHGVADDNVHFQNAVEMCNALINANKQFETYYYPNRNHGIFGGNARIHLYTKMTNFIKEKI